MAADRASLFTDGIRRGHPAEYKRDHRSHVSVVEFNHWLPWFQCTACGMWLFGDQKHNVDKCDHRKAMRAE